jgi:hypothetical protein
MVMPVLAPTTGERSKSLASGLTGALSERWTNCERDDEESRRQYGDIERGYFTVEDGRSNVVRPAAINMSTHESQAAS